MSTLNLPDLEVYELKVHVLTFLEEREFNFVLCNKKWLHDFTVVEISYPQREGYNHSITFDKSQNAYEILKGIKEKRINCTYLRSEIFEKLECSYCSRICMSGVVCMCGVCKGCDGVCAFECICLCMCGDVCVCCVCGQ